MANKKIPGKSDATKNAKGEKKKVTETVTVEVPDRASRSLVGEPQVINESDSAEEPEPPMEVVVVGDEPPIDDKPQVGDEPPEDIEPEGNVAARADLLLLRERLTNLGYSSVFEVLREGPAAFLANAQQMPDQTMTDTEAGELFAQAQARAASLTRFYSQLSARCEPALKAVEKLEVAVASSQMTRSLSTGGSYTSWFSQNASAVFAHPDSAGSLFSPASYLTDLYRVAKPLHPSTSGLRLDIRRPDLGQLKLSDSNINEEISTLQLTLEVLEGSITGDVDELLRTKLHPINLPYNHAYEQIRQGMAVKKSNLPELWSVLGDFEGQALKQQASQLGWDVRMPAIYGRDALGMSPELSTMLCAARITSFGNVAALFGLGAVDYIYHASMLKQALEVGSETLISLLGSGLYYNLSDPAIVPAQSYGAAYINGWSTTSEPASKPLYWYLGVALGQPGNKPANDPNDADMYNRSNNGYDRLNRIFRLQRHVKVLSFEELDWFICQASSDLDSPSLAQALQALAVYLPLRERYGMTVDSFGACLGLLNTFHAAGKSSFYSTLFGDADLIGLINVDFKQATTHQASLNTRARLCQGLQIDDGTLIVLAQFLPGITADQVLPVLGLEQISALYRLVAIARLFGLSVAQALQLWDLLGAPGAIVQALAAPGPKQVALGVLISTGYLIDWMHSAQLTPEQLIALTSRQYPTRSTPELQNFIENIYSTLTGRPVDVVRDAAEDADLRTQLARHIAAEFNLKPTVAAAALVWVDAVASTMAPTLSGYGLLGFWADIERVCLGDATLDGLPNAVQYAYLMRQFAQVCHWAQLGEQDLQILMPANATTPSALTGALTPPQLTLELLLLLSRYRSWQRRLGNKAGEAQGLLLRTAIQAPTLQACAQQISDLQGWDLAQTLVLMGNTVPRNFVALLPLLQRMQLLQRLGLSASDFSWVSKLTQTAAIDQATLKLIAAKIMAAAHG